MLLDVGVSAIKATDDNLDDLQEVFIPYADENFDDIDIHDLVDEDIQDENFNETSVNFNEDVSKIAINDILNEMRMGSPIENDLLNDFLSDESSYNFNQFGNGDFQDSTINPNVCYDYNFNEIQDFRDLNTEVIDNDDNLIDQLLRPELGSMPDIQVEFNDGVKFQYDASEQFNCDPDFTLPYTEELVRTEITEDNNGLNFGYDNNNNYAIHIDHSNDTNQTDYALESYFNETQTVSNNNNNNNNNNTFECSTTLPMTPDELQDDIQKYLNNEENYSYASFLEYAGMINNTNNNQGDNKLDFPYDSELLQEYINEQNNLLQSLDTINPVDCAQSPKIAPPEQYKTFQCTWCHFFSNSLQGLGVHMRVHSETLLNCTECKYTTTSPTNLKHHQAFGHGAAYYCQYCDYVTHSNAKIKLHMRREH